MPKPTENRFGDLVAEKLKSASGLLAEHAPEILDEIEAARKSADEEPQKVCVVLRLEFEAQTDGRVIVGGDVSTARALKRKFPLEGEILDTAQVPLNLEPKD